MIYLGQPHMILNHHISRKGKIETKNEADLARDSLEEWVKSFNLDNCEQDEQSNQVNILPPIRNLLSESNPK